MVVSRVCPSNTTMESIKSKFQEMLNVSLHVVTIVKTFGRSLYMMKKSYEEPKLSNLASSGPQVNIHRCHVRRNQTRDTEKKIF